MALSRWSEFTAFVGSCGSVVKLGRLLVGELLLVGSAIPAFESNASAALIVTDVDTLATTTNNVDANRNESGTSLEHEEHFEQVELTTASPTGSSIGQTFGLAKYEVYALDHAFRIYGTVSAQDATGASDPAPRVLADVRVFFDVYFTLSATTTLATAGTYSYELKPGGSFFPGVGDTVTFGLEFDGGPYRTEGITVESTATVPLAAPAVTLGPGNHYFRASFAAVTSSTQPGHMSFADMDFDFTIAPVVPEGSCCAAAFWVTVGSVLVGRMRARPTE